MGWRWRGGRGGRGGGVSGAEVVGRAAAMREGGRSMERSVALDDTPCSVSSSAFFTVVRVIE